MATAQQQQISKDLHLVDQAVDHDGLLVDVYASLDSDGYALAAVTAHGDKRDLMPIMSSSSIDYYTGWVERNCDISPAARLANVRREISGAYSGYALQRTAA